ncbi:MAG: hypothetical protein ACI90V_013336, partial [Bacillariaceae sp.]
EHMPTDMPKRSNAFSNRRRCLVKILTVIIMKVDVQ